jgi:DNA processing protein
LRLALVPGVGPLALRRLLARFGAPDAVAAASPADLAQEAGPACAAAIAQGPDADLLEAHLQWAAAPNHHVVTLADATYPPLLLETADPPPLLFVLGDPSWLSRPALAVVGSRSASRGGTQDAEAFARALSDAGLTIVSGLALGIDAAAHRGGLQESASSVAVVGTGLDRVYPARNRELAHALAERGALVSEFPLGTPPLPGNFPRRNRIISGLARGCLVIEAALESGSLITARMALEQGREVFAVPGSIHSPLSKGCHWLIKQGAKLVESAQDVLDELGVHASARPAAPDADAGKPAPAAHKLLNALDFAPFDLDAACAAGGLTPDAASAILLMLELDGYVDRLPGGRFQRRR